MVGPSVARGSGGDAARVDEGGEVGEDGVLGDVAVRDGPVEGDGEAHRGERGAAAVVEEVVVAPDPVDGRAEDRDEARGGRVVLLTPCVRVVRPPAGRKAPI